MTGPVPVEEFNCPKCGGRLQLRGGERTETIVCEHCRSLFDMKTTNGQRLAAYREKFDVIRKPWIPRSVSA